jgi:hypothetical protein
MFVARHRFHLRNAISLKWPGPQICGPRGPRQVLGPYGRVYEPTGHLRDSYHRAIADMNGGLADKKKKDKEKDPEQPSA